MNDLPFTVEMFTDTTSLLKHSMGHVLTIEQVGERRSSVISHNFVGHDQNVMFYSDNHLFGYPLLPKECVPCTFGIPYRVAPRPGFEDGLITNGAEMVRFDRHCRKNLRILETVEELVDYLNQHYSEIGQGRKQSELMR